MLIGKVLLVRCHSWASGTATCLTSPVPGPRLLALAANKMTKKAQKDRRLVWTDPLPPLLKEQEKKRKERLKKEDALGPIHNPERR